MVKSCLRALLFCALLFGLNDPIHPAPGAGSAGYRIATVAWAGWSPLHVAHEKGLWKRLGVDVEVVDYDDPIIILEAMKAGRIDFAMDMAGTLVGVYMDGTPILALAETNWSHGGDHIITKPGHSLRDHVGEPVGVFLNRPSCLYFLHLFLEPRNLRVSDYRIVEINPEDMAAQFAAGRLPVIVSYDPWALEAVRRGNGVSLATSRDFKGCIPECLWAYADRLKTIPSEDVRKVIRGWIHAVRWIRDPDHWPEFRDILNRRTFRKNKPYDDAELRRLMEGVKIHDPAEMAERNRTGGGLYGYLRSVRAFLREEGMLRRPYEVADVFENRFVMEALALERKVAPPE
ncbi:MAG: ABC transporter substrate-binding protein [Deltaproteobacteria bacterium]|nr:ABC transporter substrate-binding protein [Deltaproteobacteria bacterium]